MKLIRVFLSLQPVGYKKPARADPFTYQDKRPSRWRASWWTRGTTTEMYRSKIVATKEEAVGLALKYLVRWNKEAINFPARGHFVDTTDYPERYGYSHAPAEKKPAVQLEREIAKALEERK